MDEEENILEEETRKEIDEKPLVPSEQADFDKSTKKRIKNLKKTKLGRFDQRFNLVSSIFFKLGIWIFVFIMGFLLWTEIRSDQTMIESFQVPLNMEEQGYSGVVVANLLMDEIKGIKQKGSTIRETKEVASSMEINQMDLQIVGLGFSIRTFAHYLKKSLGIPERTVSGEFIQTNDQLLLNLRISGFYAEKYKVPLDQDIDIASKKLLKKAAKDVMYYLEPYQLAVALSDYDNRYECLDVIQYLINKNPEEKKWAYNLWGNLLDQEFQDYPSAMDKYKKAIEADPNFRLPYSNFGYMLFRLDSLDQAEKYITKAIKLDKTYTFGYKILADIKFKRGDEEEALKMYEDALEYVGNASEVYRSLGNLYLESNETKKAEGMYLKSLDRNPLNSNTIDDIIELYRNIGQFDKAHQYCDYYSDNLPQYNAGDLQHALTYIMQGVTDSAQYHLDVSRYYNQQMGFWHAVQSGIYAMEQKISPSVAHMDSAIMEGFNLEEYASNPIVQQMSQAPEFLALFEKHNIQFD